METYKDSGVDIAKADSILSGVASTIKNTHNRNYVLDTGNDFASFVRVPDFIKNPVMVSSTDGVGTKLKLALEYDHLDNIGTDLVAMCVNDLITSGAYPLYFLDYYATGKLDTSDATRIISGIARACKLSRLSLVGGETAEMPSLYNGRDFDLAGFVTGIVDESKILSRNRVSVGDSIIGVQSSGFHSNGYSLINKILESNNISDYEIELILEPTRLYVDMLFNVKNYINSAANITGGGLFSNIQRAIPANCRCEIYESKWEKPEIYSIFSKYHGLTDEVMYSTFNQGIGMTLIVDPDNVDIVLDRIECPAWVIGKVI